jgi:hypothetical protein
MNQALINDLRPLTDPDNEIAADCVAMHDRIEHMHKLITDTRSDYAEGRAIGFRLAELQLYAQTVSQIAQSIAVRC